MALEKHNPSETEVDLNMKEMKKLFSKQEEKGQEEENDSEQASSSEKRKSAEIKVQISDDSARLPGNHIMTKKNHDCWRILDIALFTTNCEQLKFVLELGDLHIYYNEVLGLLITSLILQLLVGLTMFLLGCQVMHKDGNDAYSNF
ncbi:uncharacterized protein CEXT_771561 [Caerostris extrusa]|uniref:Uncharacterized protein n=1 Tax=Caerostris extrusa TaxID=172846 RepID=A0AAV4YEA1_CAEEX|nr:uncharacterized protein CEXT_771561 [Caerostris extrusa]